jgi:hypothetical protein
VSKDHAIDAWGDIHRGVSADDVINICKWPIGGVSPENLNKMKAGRRLREVEE